MSLKNFKNIGDSLNTNEFNGLISLYRNFRSHSENLEINDVIISDFGKYEFDIEDTTILDIGILITNETISAEPKVRLSDALFSNSTYTLVLNVLHYTGVNILDDITPSNYKVIDTLEVELTPNEWVDIPVEDLEEDYIISFDAKVEIKHDKTVRQGSWVNELTLTSNKDIIQTSETATLTATVTDIGDIHVPGRTVTFKAYHGDTLVETIGTATTDSNGHASVSYTGKGAGLLNIQASIGMLQSITYVTDTVFYDDGVTDEGYKKFYNYAAFNPQVQSDGTLLTNSASTTYNYFANIGTTGDLYDFETPCVVEFDIVSFNASFCGINIAESGQTNILKNFSQHLGISGNEPFNMKIMLTGSQIIYKVNNNVVLTENYNTTKARVSLTLNNGTLKYKNFLIYPV